jgi:ArsR family metal-binding transcriptional regulator
LKWLRREINSAWENREGIVPCFEGMPKPNLVEILKLLPQTNCRKCGEPTCMVFAARLGEGVQSVDACPEMEMRAQRHLEHYLEAFSLD